RPSELQRLEKLQERGIPLTEHSLKALGIAVPGSKVDDGLAARELQSLADGQVVLDPSRSRFPAIEPGASFSRFGLGSTSGPEAKARDVRPPALQAVAAHLRTLLALESEARFRPAEQEVDRHQTRQMECVAAALRQPADAPLLWQEMTALLLAASSGALDTLPLDEAMDSLAGGSRSPLLLHLRDAAPGALQKITEEAQPSQSTIRELEVALRLFVKLKEADMIR
ncbi:ATP synthase subunit alpha (ATP synthase F1 sector subunit alpha) (F-ATPase subunit alpha), partial [Durusdinium trenchii]